MSFQEGALFDSMTVFDNVAFPLRRSGRRSPAEVRARVEECLELVQLPDVGAKRPSELSGGMRRRVGFARAIAHQPEILLFDEPNTGLDPIMTDIIDEVILEIREQMEPTIVTITHHMPSAAEDRRPARAALRRPDPVRGAAGGVPEFEDPAVRQFVRGPGGGAADRRVGESEGQNHFGGAMSTAAKVGAFFLVALAITGLLIWKIEDLHLGRAPAATVSVQFKDVAGLKEKSDVRVAGVLVGKVAQIRLVGGKALVDLELDQDVELREGASPRSRASGCWATSTSS